MVSLGGYTRTTGAPSGQAVNSVTYPAETINGDWVIVIMLASTGDQTVIRTLNTTGWETIRAFGSVNPVTTAATQSFGLYARKVAGGEPSWDFPVTNPALGNAVQMRCFNVTGADAFDTWVLGAFANRASNATTLTAVAPSITSQTADALAILIAAERTAATETAGQITVNNSFTAFNVDVATADQSTIIATRTPGAVATGNTTVTYPNSHAQNAIAGMLSIPRGGLSVLVSDGTALVPGNLLVSDGTDLQMVSRVLKVKAGYPSVAAMLATPQFRVAHRGGSRQWPEMSLYAYVQSTLHGWNAIEVSVARTLDGVWFGLHDQTLDRTSGTTGADPSTMTWAQVQTNQILGSTCVDNPTTPNRPYSTLAAILDAYQDHVIFIDPKHALGAGWGDELLDILDTYPNSTDRFVAKFFGVQGGFPENPTSSWAFRASARGYQTWGYFYQTDVPDLPNYQGRWSILGMDYAADQASWNAILSYGKPVIGHIIPTLTAADLALTKGADGLMVSGAGTVSPT